VAYGFYGFYYMIVWYPEGNAQSLSMMVTSKFSFHWNLALIKSLFSEELNGIIKPHVQEFLPGSGSRLLQEKRSKKTLS
jgi:hypothetical protein